MSAISLKSITGITSITTPAGVDNQLTLHTNDTSEKLRIASDGKIGIGTANPSNALDVQGGTTNTAIVARSTDAKAQVSLVDNSTSSVGSVCIGAEGDNLFLTSGSGGAERFRITSDGRFSLGNGGNATPSAAFHLDYDSNNLLMLDNATGATQKMFFAQNGGTHAQIYATSAAGSLIFDSDPDNNHNTSIIGFNIDGGAKLQIGSSGNFTFFNNAAVWNTIQRATATHYIGLRIQETDGTQRMQFGVAGGANNIATGAAQHDVVLKSYANLLLATNQTEAVRITPAGVIGINDTNPGTGKKVKVVVANNSSYQMAVNLTNNVNADINFYIKTNESLIAPSTNTPLCLGTGGAEKLRINSSGQLIMTNAATQTFADFSTTNNNTRALIKLDGKDSSGNAVSLRMGGFGDTSRGEIFTQSNHGLGFATNNAASQMILDTSGRLLIGHTSSTGVAGHGVRIQSDAVGSNYGEGALALRGTGGDFYAITMLGNSGNAFGVLPIFSSATDRLDIGYYDGPNASNSGALVSIKQTGKVDVAGNIAFTNGSGIDFSAETDEGGSTRQGAILADYEEGIWTPTNTIGMTLTVNNGAHYIKIGKQVTVWFDVSLTGNPDSAQCASIENLPYVSKSSNTYYGQSNMVWYSNTGDAKRDYDDDNTLIFVNNNSTTIRIWNVTSGHDRVRSWANGRRFRGTVTYIAKN